ncbi:Arm DNA-binding domain-containing protein [Lebetimonas sp. JH292]|uniref:Arm DNA-binding domain-containing protein n=1 Tax=Lebetimonas sp. JH292 TaxID=990068 RepID=UPI0004675A0C|nr:Arm DNA-binding domain-containing protein [Lebetimonas sp. JH292]
MGTNLGTKKITAVVIKNLKPTGKEEWIRIEEGLYLRIRKTGKKVLKLMQARKMNLEIREKIASGIDPLQEKQREKKEQIEAEKVEMEENGWNLKNKTLQTLLI